MLHYRVVYIVVQLQNTDICAMHSKKVIITCKNIYHLFLFYICNSLFYKFPSKSFLNLYSAITFEWVGLGCGMKPIVCMWDLSLRGRGSFIRIPAHIYASFGVNYMENSVGRQSQPRIETDTSRLPVLRVAPLGH